MPYLCFDSETTGKCRFDLPSNHPAQPMLVQVAAILFDENHNEQASFNVMIKPLDNWIIPDDVVEVHGITTEHANQYGVMPAVAAKMFDDLVSSADILVAHNMNFDMIVMENFLSLFYGVNSFDDRKTFCTMKAATSICKLPSSGYGEYKWPRLSEAYRIIVGKEMDHDQAHSALYDTRCCTEIYKKLMREKDISN